MMTIGLVAVLAACERTTPPPKATGGSTAAAAASAGALPRGKPMVELWNGGIHLAGINPFLVFAAWEDGTVLARGTAATAWRTRPEAPLRVGRAAPGAIAGLVRECEQAGFFRPPIEGPVVYPDGPEYWITVRARGRTGELRYHGGDLGLGEVGPDGSPVRAEVAALDRFWRRVEAAIAGVAVGASEPYRGQEPAPGW